jgi:hypothetical protein
MSFHDYLLPLGEIEFVIRVDFASSMGPISGQVQIDSDFPTALSYKPYSIWVANRFMPSVDLWLKLSQAPV